MTGDDNEIYSKFYEIVDLEEPVSGGVVDPWVVVGAADTSLQVDGLPWKFFARQFARMRHPASGPAFHRALLPPRLEVLYLGDGPGVLDPLNDLSHRDEIDVVVVGQHLVDPVEESVEVLWVVLQPSGVEVQTQRSSVFLVVAVKIVVQEVIKLISR